jgi:hypothetical protein
MLQFGETGRFDKKKYTLTMMLIQSQCYAEHFNDYKYVAAFDNDEVIFPNRAGFSTMNDQRAYIAKMELQPEKLPTTQINSALVINDFKCNRYELLSGNSGTFEKYLNELSAKLKVVTSDPRALYFHQSYFISLNLTDQIFRNLQHALNEKSANKLDSSASSVISFSITDWDRIQPHSFNFTIVNKNEFQYAVNLLKIYKTVIQPYLVKNRKIIQDNVQYYDRLFSIVGQVNSFALGKTMHDTRVTVGLTIHFMEVCFFFN